MSVKNSRLLLLLVALLLAASLFALHSRDTPERRIRARIDQLELALSTVVADTKQRQAERIERAFEESIVENVAITIPDFPELSSGRDALTELARRATADARGLEVRATNVDVRPDREGSRATALLRAEVGRPGDELHKDVRHVTLRFAPEGGAWRVTSVEVAARTHEEPEARP